MEYQLNKDFNEKHLSPTNHVERFVTKSLLSVIISTTHNERALIRITVIVFRGENKT